MRKTKKSWNFSVAKAPGSRFGAKFFTASNQIDAIWQEEQVITFACFQQENQARGQDWVPEDNV